MEQGVGARKGKDGAERGCVFSFQEASMGDPRTEREREREREREGKHK